MLYLSAVFKQAVMNLYVIPCARMQRKQGLEIKTSVFKAPKIEDKDDFTEVRWRSFPMENESDDINSNHMINRPDDHFAQAKATLIDPDSNTWKVSLYNVDSVANPEPIEDGLVLYVRENVFTLDYLKDFEILAHDIEGGKLERSYIAEVGEDYPEDHILNVAYRLEVQASDSPVVNEMIARKTYALVRGEDLSGNLRFGEKETGTILSPNMYHHFRPIEETGFVRKL